MKIAALQMVSQLDVPSNLSAAKALVGQAAAGGAEVVVLPEYFGFMGQRDHDKLALQEQDGDGLLQNFLSALAREHQLTLIGGTIPIRSDKPEFAYNSCLVYGSDGCRIARYDKMHLFSFHNGRESYNEAHTLRAGQSPVALSITSRDGQDWRIGLGVCYDLRFPELFRDLAADLLVLPAAFTYTTGQAHWEVLLRARAIENLAYVVASAQGGRHENGRATWGNSMVIDPWGTILTRLQMGVGIIHADIDKEALNHLRRQLPALKHRKIGIPQHGDSLASREHRPPDNKNQNKQSPYRFK